nr:HNH endonuclease family protein [Dietzia timorensis]
MEVASPDFDPFAGEPNEPAPEPLPPEPTPVPEEAPAPPPPADAQPSGAPADLVNAARIGLPMLEVKGRAPKTGYERELFGQAWSDDVTVAGGHNGCDTRNDILARDLDNIVFKEGTRDCVVLTGTLADPFSAELIEFQRGKGTSQAVQIDHMVALSDAWQKGAQQLSEEERRNFANDPLNLQAVKGSLNSQKGDGDAATWLPPNVGYRCEYVARQIVVKQEYRLWVTAAERDAMDRELSRC